MLKRTRCFKSLPEYEWYDWATEYPKGTFKLRHKPQHPFYTCLTCGKIYCISCWSVTILSFDKVYPNRKDRRKSYHKSASFDPSCRPHGGCPYCERNRQFQDKKARQKADFELKEYEERSTIYDSNKRRMEELSYM